MPIVNYFEVAADFELAPAEALAFFQAKGLKATFDWRDQLGDEHDLAFTVAKMMDLDLLHTVKRRLDSALENGDSLADFKRELIPELQKAGWWGKQDVIDPKTGRSPRPSWAPPRAWRLFSGLTYSRPMPWAAGRPSRSRPRTRPI